MNVKIDSKKSTAPVNASFSAESIFKSIMERIPDLISVVDRDLRLVYTNLRPEQANFNQDLLKTLTRPHCYEFYCPGRIIQCEECCIREVLETGREAVVENYIPNVGQVETHLFPIYDDNGNIVMAVAYHRNINACRQEKDAIKSKNQVLEAIINASPLAIIAMDNQQNITFWNPAATKLFDWERDEVLGKPYQVVSEFNRTEIMENLRILSTGKSFNCLETRRTQRDGTLIDVSIDTAPMLSDQGTEIGFMVIMSDISERKLAQEALRESEMNYRTIFDAANDATFVFNPENGDILDVNRKMCEMYGYTREEGLKLNVEDLSAGEPPYTYNDIMKKIWKTKYDKSHLFEWYAKNSSGRLFWVEINMKGAMIGGDYKVLGVVKDITERKAAEEESRKMQDQLRRVDKMVAIGTLASGIAHEINNPNNFILSNAQIISELWPEINRMLSLYAQDHGDFNLGRLPFSEANTLIPKLLNSVVEGAHRINAIVIGLKNFARDEKTCLDQPVDINKVIEAALAMIHNQIRNHTEKFQSFLGDKLPPVTGSFQQLEQVVVNLVMNALQALRNRSEGVIISSSFASDRDEVTIEVKDEGVGISEDTLQVIFDPFFTTKLETGGTGLGLSICFSIVKDHGGIIECKSEPGSGSVFLVRIPVKQKRK